MYNPLSPLALGLPPPGAKFDTTATYVRSHVLSPYTLAFLRALIAIYCWTTIIVAYTWLSLETAPNTLRDVDIPAYTLILGTWFIAKSFSFFTFITFWSLAFYFSVAAWHTFAYATRGQALQQDGTSPPPTVISQLHDTFPRGLQLAHALWFTTITTYPFLVSIVYWGTMYAGGGGAARPSDTSSPFTAWVNVSVHGLNSIFALSEILFSAVRPPPFLSHLLVVLTGLSLYLGVAYITRVHQGFYVYEWMNPVWGAGGIVGHVFGYAGGMVGIYALVWGAMWSRERLVVGRKMESEQVVDEGEGVWQVSVISSRRQSCGSQSTGGKEAAVSVQEV